MADDTEHLFEVVIPQLLGTLRDLIAICDREKLALRAIRNMPPAKARKALAASQRRAEAMLAAAVGAGLVKPRRKRKAAR